MSRIPPEAVVHLLGLKRMVTLREGKKAIGPIDARPSILINLEA